MSKETNKVVIKLKDKEVEIELSDFEVTDIQKELKTLPEKIFEIGKLLAHSIHEKIHVDSYFEQWKALNGKKIIEKKKYEKLPEWRLNQKLINLSEYDKLKQAQRSASEVVNILQSAYDALKIKSKHLIALIALETKE